MIIDCHAHLNRYTPEVAATLPERHAALRRDMNAHGVDYALVLASYDVTAERPSTADVLAQVADDGKIGVVAGVRWDHIDADLPELDALLEGGGIKALKLYPGYEPVRLCSPELQPVYDLAAKYDVPVMVHTGDTFEPDARVRYAHPLEVDDAAVERRDVRFVVCHLGNPWLMDAAEVIYKNPNVFGDISGFTLGAFEPRFAAMMKRRVDDVIAYLNDPAKLMFGTDWPICDLGSYLAFTRTLEMTDEERDGLMWKNAARVFNLGFEVRVERADATGVP